MDDYFALSQQRVSSFFATIEWVHSDTADEIDRDAGEVHLASWDILNLRIGYQWKYCTLHVGVDNLFDQLYTVANVLRAAPVYVRYDLLAI